MGMAAPVYWTAEQVRQLPDDGKRYEVVYGELLVTPAPRLGHQLLVTRLSSALFNYTGGALSTVGDGFLSKFSSKPSSGRLWAYELSAKSAEPSHIGVRQIGVRQSTVD